MKWWAKSELHHCWILPKITSAWFWTCFLTKIRAQFPLKWCHDFCSRAQSSWLQPSRRSSLFERTWWALLSAATGATSSRPGRSLESLPLNWMSKLARSGFTERFVSFCNILWHSDTANVEGRICVCVRHYLFIYLSIFFVISLPFLLPSL